MKALFTLLIFLLISPQLLAKHGLSAKRPAGVSTTNFLAFRSFSTQGYPSVLSVRQEEILADLTKVQDWDPVKDINEAFARVRDIRFLYWTSGFDRRATWLYPDDGCFMRAEFAARHLEAWGYPKPSKIFVFGDLTVQTKNSPLGQVSWWYHVVVGYRLGGQVLVFDPSIEPTKTLTFQEWKALMSKVSGSDITVSVCDSHAYDPDSNCEKGDPNSEQTAVSDSRSFLSNEWDRLLELNRDPNRELGDYPPWVNKSSFVQPINK